MGAKVECSVQKSDQSVAFAVSKLRSQLVDEPIARLSHVSDIHAVMHDDEVR